MADEAIGHRLKFLSDWGEKPDDKFATLSLSGLTVQPVLIRSIAGLRRSMIVINVSLKDSSLS
jgi:hypothetical protein